MGFAEIKLGKNEERDRHAKLKERNMVAPRGLEPRTY